MWSRFRCYKTPTSNYYFSSDLGGKFKKCSPSQHFLSGGHSLRGVGLLRMRPPAPSPLARQSDTPHLLTVFLTLTYFPYFITFTSKMVRLITGNLAILWLLDNSKHLLSQAIKHLWSQSKLLMLDQIQKVWRETFEHSVSC